MAFRRVVRARAEKTLRKALDLGMQSIWLTVDAPVVSRSLRSVSSQRGARAEIQTMEREVNVNET